MRIVSTRMLVVTDGSLRSRCYSRRPTNHGPSFPFARLEAFMSPPRVAA